MMVEFIQIIFLKKICPHFHLSPFSTSTINKLARNVRQVFDYLRMTKNTHKLFIYRRYQEN